MDPMDSAGPVGHGHGFRASGSAFHHGFAGGGVHRPAMRVVHGGGHRYALSGGHAYVHARQWLRLWSSLCLWPAWLRLSALWRRLLCRRILISVLRGRLLSPPPSILRRRLLLRTSSWLLVVPPLRSVRYALLVLRSSVRVFCAIYGYSYEPSYGYAYGVHGGAWRGGHRGYAWTGWHGGRGHAMPLVGAAHINGSPQRFRCRSWRGALERPYARAFYALNAPRPGGLAGSFRSEREVRCEIWRLRDFLRRLQLLPRLLRSPCRLWLQSLRLRPWLRGAEGATLPAAISAMVGLRRRQFRPYGRLRRRSFWGFGGGHCGGGGGGNVPLTKRPSLGFSFGRSSGRPIFLADGWVQATANKRRQAPPVASV